MKQKIKFFLSSLLKLKKKAVLFLFLFVLIGLALPNLAFAIFGLIGAGIVSFALLFGQWMVRLMIWLTVTNIAVGVGLLFLEWVIGSSLNSPKLSYTTTQNPVIDIGLSVTQGLANMFLVLVLVFIGIATMLNLEGYETKKLLRKFIIVALLVNFAPVILGVVVDFTNLLMNFFLSRGTAGSSIIVAQLLTFGKTIFDLLDWKTLIPIYYPELILKVILVMIANLLFFLIFAIFALALLTRRIVIWILVILAPIAFVFSILPFPITRRYWEQWYTAFVDWSLLGVFLSFFLFLGNTASSQLSKHIPAGEGIGTIFPFFVPLILYFIGLMMGLQVGGIGSKTLVGLKKSGLAIGGRKAQQTAEAIGKKPQYSARYQAGRALGLSPVVAAAEAMRAYHWRKRIMPALKHPGSAIKGDLKALWGGVKRLPGLPKRAAAGVAAAAKGVVRVAKDPKKVVSFVGTGIKNAISDFAATSMAGIRAGFGTKRRGKKTCPTCGKTNVSASAIACPSCGHVF